MGIQPVVAAAAAELVAVVTVQHIAQSVEGALLAFGILLVF